MKQEPIVMTCALQVQGLVKHFGGVLATDYVSLSLHYGELLALIGPNGAGKSTLIGQMAGEIVSDEGDILLDGQSIMRLSVAERARRGLGRTFQITQLITEFTALENVAVAARAREPRGLGTWAPLLGSRSAVPAARQALRRVGLDDRADAPVSTLSHGERKQLELAMVLALRPKVLLLDEPLAGMSPAESECMARLMAELKTEYPILLIEHDMGVVFSLADRIGVLDSGTLIALGTPEEIKESELVRASYLGEEELA